ncbi:MAG: CotH kinase family protein [Polyangiales bacterium]
MLFVRCLLPALAVLTLGCTAAHPKVSDDAPVRAQQATDADPSAALFDDRSVPRVDFTVAASDLAALRRDPDAYVRATMRWGTETLRDVGLRIKGEGSLRSIDKKAAFKVKTDAFVAGQSLRGLKRLTLNNMVEDPSFLAERLAYHVFRAAGLPAPRCNSAEVTVNGAAYGLYANVESEDKPFLRRWFARDEGNLYEEGQSDFVPGAERKFDLETNEDLDDRADLRRFIEVVNAGAADDSLLARWGTVLDVEHFLRFTAAEAAVNQWDMYAYTVFYPNNFRMYHDPASDRFVMLPWGMDMSMKPYRDSGRAHIPVFGIAREYDRARGKVTAGVLFRRCLESAACKARYARVVEETAGVYESEQLEALAARYYAQIAPLVKRDPRREYSDAQFEAGYRALLTTIRTRPAAMRKDVAALR